MTIIVFYVTRYLLKFKIQNRQHINQRQRQVRTILSQFGKFLKFGASYKINVNTDCFKLVIDNNLTTDTKETADTFNDYFVDIASKLKDLIETCDFKELKEHID